jgi:hypothetical protein
LKILKINKLFENENIGNKRSQKSSNSKWYDHVFTFDSGISNEKDINVFID